MEPAPLRIPDRLRRTAEARGSEARAWLEGLEGQVAAIAGRWGIEVGAVAPGGTEAFVVAVRDAGGGEAVLKVGMTGVDPLRQEIRILRAAQGSGFARLLRADEAQNVMLLERLGPQLHQLGLTEERQIAAICGALRQAWQAPAPEGPPLATAAAKAAELRAQITTHWEKVGRSCSEGAVTLAVAFAERRARAFDPAAAVLCHGDAHQWNTLAVRGASDAFKLVDPDGAWAEPAYDLAIFLREWVPAPPRALRLAAARRRCALLAQAGGASAQAIWEWGLLQLVSNGLLLVAQGLPENAAPQLAMADSWVEAAEA